LTYELLAGTTLFSKTRTVVAHSQGCSVLFV